MPDVVKITKLKISKTGQPVYIATEYLGAQNLQASAYLRGHDGYCFSGDLGPATDFKIDKSSVLGSLYSIAVTSKSGPYEFLRRFGYAKETRAFQLVSCDVRQAPGRWSKCTSNE